MRQAILTWMSTVSAPDIVLAAVTAMFGLIIGWLIWGGRRRYIAQLEDDLSQARKQTRSILVANRRDHVERDDVEAVLAPQKQPHKPPVERVCSASRQQPLDDRTFSGELRESDQMVRPPQPDMAVAAKLVMLDQARDERLAALTDELAKIRVLLGKSVLNTDPVKESLDKADTSIKRANGRLKIIMSSPPLEND